jgi:hypothetical protein
MLHIEAAWYCKTDDECHDEAHQGREVEVSYTLEHPDCPIPPCCCTWRLGPEPGAPTWRGSIDPNCELGSHDECLNRPRCATEQQLSDNGLDTYELPQATGVYRIQSWFDGPDYWGEYDEGIEWAPLGSTP